jgi:hypothetical protein
MKRFLTLALGIALSLALAAPVAAAHPVRPFGGGGTGTDTMDGPVGCPESFATGGWRYGSTGTMHLLHLGRTTFAVSHCSMMTGPTTGVFGSGTNTLTAANGDTLVLRHWGTFSLTMGSAGPVRSDVDLHWTVVSGTGRFEGATGSGDGVGYSILAGGKTTMLLWGKISY